MSGIPKKARTAALTFLMVFTWLIAVMVYSERFVPPFTHLELWLMPWKALYTIPGEDSLEKRLATMQHLLDASNNVARWSFATMVVSFSAFTIFLSVLYQQKQRRARENMLLLLKNQEISRRNEFIRYISATISHEFKNNLGRIKRRLDLLRELPSEVRERIGDNFDKLFADINIFKKISDERESALVEFENININDMLNRLVRQYADLADIVIHESAEAPLIYASPPLLQTVFENIIDNAVKYKQAKQPRALIHIVCSTDNDFGRRYLAISVRDEGIGMDEQQADHCFYKGKGAGERWGQGLYFAKYVMGLHAGRIRIDKEHTSPGVGTEIIVNLPFVEET